MWSRGFELAYATTPAARAALATSVVAHAVVELETQLIELKRQLTTK